MENCPKCRDLEAFWLAEAEAIRQSEEEREKIEKEKLDKSKKEE
jgi:hypothetical protein